MCVNKLPFSLKDLSQWGSGQVNGRSPVYSRQKLQTKENVMGTYVEALVNLEPTGAGVLLITIFKATNKRFHPGVGQLVSLKMPFCDEMLRALRTCERTLASMSAHMRFQVACLLEFFQTSFKRTNQ